MTNEEVIQYVYAHIGSEEETQVTKPEILAFANLALADLAKFLLESSPDLSKKLIKTLANQTWASSAFSAPADMLFENEMPTVRIDLGGVLVHQVADRKKLFLVTAGQFHYCALEGKTFYIKHTAGTTTGTNLNISYYKIPAVTDIDDELRSLFLSILIARITNGKSEYTKLREQTSQPSES